MLPARDRRAGAVKGPIRASCSARARSTTTSSGTSSARAERIAVARIEQLYPFPVEAGRRGRRVLPVRSTRWSGRRRSHRTWAPGARSDTGSKRPPPVSRFAMSAAPGGRARRGVSDRAHARAEPHCPRRPDPVDGVSVRRAPPCPSTQRGRGARARPAGLRHAPGPGYGRRWSRAGPVCPGF